MIKYFHPISQRIIIFEIVNAPVGMIRFCQLHKKLPLLVHFSSWSYPINGHVENFTRSNNCKESVNALENSDHHFVLILGSRFVLWMGTRMDNSIHIQVQIIEFHLIGVGFCCVHGLSDTIAFLSLKSSLKNEETVHFKIPFSWLKRLNTFFIHQI